MIFEFSLLSFIYDGKYMFGCKNSWISFSFYAKHSFHFLRNEQTKFITSNSFDSKSCDRDMVLSLNGRFVQHSVFSESYSIDNRKFFSKENNYSKKCNKKFLQFCFRNQMSGIKVTCHFKILGRNLPYFTKFISCHRLQFA